MIKFVAGWQATICASAFTIARKGGTARWELPVRVRVQLLPPFVAIVQRCEERDPVPPRGSTPPVRVPPPSPRSGRAADRQRPPVHPAGPAPAAPRLPDLASPCAPRLAWARSRGGPLGERLPCSGHADESTPPNISNRSSAASWTFSGAHRGSPRPSRRPGRR